MATAQSQMTVYKSVYVGNIPLFLNEDDLLNIFMQYIDFVHSAKLMRDSHTRLNLGFGYVVVSEDDAKKLIKWSTSGNPIVVGGQNLRIERAKEERPFKQKQFIPTPGNYCYKRPPLPEIVSYEENEPDKPTIHSLNDYVLLAIFKHLQFKELFGVERVCRRWQFLIYELYRGMFWCSISEDEDYTTDRAYFEKDLVPHFPSHDSRCDFTGLLDNQIEIDWTRANRKQVVDKILKVVGENLPNLSLSQFKGSRLESRALAQLVPNIQTLCLSGTSVSVNLSPITETCKNLTHLFLDIIYINMDVMMAITKCHKLETLSGCVLSVSLLEKLPKTVKNLQVQLIETGFNIVTHIQHLKNLERLSFYKEMHPSTLLHRYPTWKSLNSRQIKCLAKNHKNLTYLRCGTEKGDVDYSVLTSLKHLQLEGSCPLSLFDNLPPKLEVLFIFPWEHSFRKSIDLSSKLPTSLHSVLVHYKYLDVKSLLTLKEVPSVTKLLVTSIKNSQSDDDNLHDLESFVTIPNLRELYFSGVQIDQREFNKIVDIRRYSLAKLKKNDNNRNQENHPLLLYAGFESGLKTDSEHVKLVHYSDL